MSREYDSVRDAFDSERAAARYVHNKHASSRRNRREEASITACLSGDTPLVGKRCIDIPCGTFRLAGGLRSLGLDVTAADYSASMLEQARRCSSDAGTAITLVRTDIAATGFADSAFDFVVCNRLFHHYARASTRTAVLRELARISRGVVVVSFFDRASASNLIRRFKHAVGIKPQCDRYAISRARLEREAGAAGLVAVRYAAPARFISPQTYVRLEHRPTGGG